MSASKRQRFAKAIVENGSVGAAAEACNISTSTAYRWSREQEVIDSVRQLKRAKMSALSAYMTKASGKAVDTVTTIMNDDEVNPQTRLQAAMFLIKIGYERLDMDDLEKRIEALEEEAQDYQG